LSQAGNTDEMDLFSRNAIVSLKSYEGNNNQMLMASGTGKWYDCDMRKESNQEVCIPVEQTNLNCSKGHLLLKMMESVCVSQTIIVTHRVLK